MRDNSLDLLKGLACLMMAIAHAPIIFKDSSVVAQLYFIGHLAPVIFFAVSGATVLFQLQGRSLKTILATYVILFFAGYSFNGIINPDIYHNLRIEIIQIIAIGCVLIAIIESRLAPANWLYLVLGAGIFGLKILLDLWAPEFDGAKHIMPRVDYTHWTPTVDYVHWFDTNTKGPAEILTGFPLLPWLFLFPLGVAAYRQSNRMNAMLAVSIGSASLLMYCYGVDLNWHEKWDMSTGYFLISCTCLFFTFFVFRVLSPWITNPNNPIVFLGRNSLLFLYVQFSMLFFAGLLSFKNQYLWWLNSILLTYLVMWFWTYKIRDAKFLQTRRGWYGLIAVILLLPLLGLVNQLFLFTVFSSELFCGILFARNYKAIPRLFA